jgi:hypothetical protein
MSRANAAWSAFRGVLLDRKVVVPYPRKYGTITRYPSAASSGATWA